MFRKNLLIFCMTALVMLFTTAGGFAQLPSYCSLYANGSGTLPLAIGVAANFDEASQQMVDNFLASNPAGNGAVYICPNSTGVLAADIADALNASQAPPFDMFFAADMPSAWNFSVPSGAAFRYAYGTPVIFGYQSNVGNVTGLISGGSLSGNTDSIDPVSNTYSIASGAISVGIADPNNAPYGAAAQSILTAMGYTIGTNITPVELPTVTAVKNAVASTYAPSAVNSGFVAKSQVCNDPTVSYVEFTGLGYRLDQWAVQLTSNADNLAAYIDDAMNDLSPTGWNAFLAANCYIAP